MSSMTSGQSVGLALEQFAHLLEHSASDLSPQFSRKLAQLLACWEREPIDPRELSTRFESVFHRLLLELIQAQSNTKQREQDVQRLIESKGCSIRDPELIDQVVDLIIRLYKATGQCSDTSFERQVLIKYILKEKDVIQGHRKRQIERVVQTIYRCSCFEVKQQDQAPSRLSLKEHLYDARELRNQIDSELIKLTLGECIRLSPDSWSYLLHGHTSQESIAHIQTILEYHQVPPCVDELQAAICRSGDKLGLGCHLDHLYAVQDLICQMRSQSANETIEDTNGPDIGLCQMLIADIMERLVNLKHLFTIRQHRGEQPLD